MVELEKGSYKLFSKSDENFRGAKDIEFYPPITATSKEEIIKAAIDIVTTEEYRNDYFSKTLHSEKATLEISEKVWDEIKEKRHDDQGANYLAGVNHIRSWLMYYDG